MQEGRATCSVTECMQKCTVYTRSYVFATQYWKYQEYEEIKRQADSLKGYLPSGLYSVAYRQKFEAFLACDTKGYFTFTLCSSEHYMIVFKKRRLQSLYFSPLRRNEDSSITDI